MNYGHEKEFVEKLRVAFLQYGLIKHTIIKDDLQSFFIKSMEKAYKQALDDAIEEINKNLVYAGDELAMSGSMGFLNKTLQEIIEKLKQKQ